MKNMPLPESILKWWKKELAINWRQRQNSGLYLYSWQYARFLFARSHISPREARAEVDNTEHCKESYVMALRCLGCTVKKTPQLKREKIHLLTAYCLRWNIIGWEWVGEIVLLFRTDRGRFPFLVKCSIWCAFYTWGAEISNKIISAETKTAVYKYSVVLAMRDQEKQKRRTKQRKCQAVYITATEIIKMSICCGAFNSNLFALHFCFSSPPVIYN